MHHIYLCLLFLSCCISTLHAKSDRYRCILRDDPATTICIGWDQLSGSNPVVYYGTVDYGQDIGSYPLKVYPQRTVHAKSMHNHFARISKLKPNTVYYFVIGDSEGNSKRYSFKTLPDDHQTQLSIIAGGDSRNLKSARLNANRMVARLRPHFVMFNGDMTGGDTNKEWVEWLDDWQKTIAEDGRMTAIVPARGNHEFKNSTITTIFDVANPDVYYGLTFARGLLRTYTLNSMMSSNGDQRQWLENDLIQHQHIAWRFAQYHHPMRPHTKRKRDNENIRKNWAPLFERFRVKLVLECDSHISKYTWPIRASKARGHDEGFIRDDQDGVVYIGEGGWGAPLRDNDDDKEWTRASGKFNQVKWIFFDLDKVQVRTVKTDNVGAVAALNDDNRFSMPKGLDLWIVDGRDYIQIFNPYKAAFRPLAPKIRTDIKIAKANTIEGDKVEVYWQTLYEEDNMRYRIQYSTNKLYWKTLKTVDGLGKNRKIPNEYLFTDKPSGRRSSKVYYRIIALDKEGNERFKRDIELRSLSSYANMEKISSSVTTGVLNVNLELFAKETVSFEIYDVSRKKVFQQKMPIDAGNHEIPLNVRHLKTGHYLLEISYGQQLLRKNIKIYKSR